MEEGAIYSAALVIPAISPPILDGAVAVKDGKLLFVGPRREARELGLGMRERHWPGILAPGLVNAHAHLQYTGMERLGKSVWPDFRAWAAAFNDMYEPIEASGASPWKDWAADGARRAALSGTTAIADVVTNWEAASALHDEGLGGIAYWEVMNETNEEWNESKETELAKRIRSIPGLAGISPHSPYSLDRVPLSRLPGIAKNLGARTHIHLAESPVERETEDPATEFKDWHSFKSKDFSDARKGGYGGSSVQYVDKLGVLGPECHIAHGVYLTAADRETLRKRKTAIAFCPRSNRVTGLDEPPIASCLLEGNLIAAGTDSLSSSPTLDLMDDVAELAILAKKQGYSAKDLHLRLVHAATLGGAIALGLGSGEGRIGQLGVGARADLAFFDIHVGSGANAIEDALAELAEGGGGKCACSFIAGIKKFGLLF
ncbi:MAG: amidohydrolase family protein [Clostridiales bacterium]|nr:amidohydrolase family protein [Clostridiales bacterium]